MDQHDESEFCKEVGRRIRRRRHIMQLTQADISRSLNAKRSYVTELEKGTYKSIRFMRLKQLAEILQTSLEYLLLLEDDDPGSIPPMRCLGVGLACRYADTSPPALVSPWKGTEYG
jgi:transcriptional regulator with XRE-family HTH domain